MVFLFREIHSRDIWLRIGHFLCPNVMINNRCSTTCLSDLQAPSHSLSLSLSLFPSHTRVKQCNEGLFYGRLCQHQIAQEICRRSYLHLCAASWRPGPNWYKETCFILWKCNINLSPTPCAIHQRILLCQSKLCPQKVYFKSWFILYF